MEFKYLEATLTDFTPINSGGVDFEPVFGYGSKRDLIEHLRQERKEGEPFYPLVWLMTPIRIDGDMFKYSAARCEVNIIIATLTNRDLSNKERVRITFQNTLEPLLEEVVRKLKYGKNVSIVEGTPFEIEKFFGYDTDSSSAVSDIWDAITLRCITKIKYC